MENNLLRVIRKSKNAWKFSSTQVLIKYYAFFDGIEESNCWLEIKLESHDATNLQKVQAYHGKDILF